VEDRGCEERLFIRKLQKGERTFSLLQVRISDDLGFEHRTSDPTNLVRPKETENGLDRFRFLTNARLTLIVQ